MSEIKFTPGPWRVVVDDDHDIWVRDDGGLIARGRYPSMYEGQDNRFHSEVSEYRANAALIAAAPDLYAALDKCVEHLRCIRDGYSTLSPEATARAALAKARGGS